MSAVAAEAAVEGLLPLYGRGFVAVSAGEVAKLAGLPPATVAVWAVLRLEAARRGSSGADLLRAWVVERTGVEATPDTVKKVPGRVRALVEAGLCLSLMGDRRRVRVEFPRRERRRGRGTGEWEPRLRGSDLARIVDPADPMGWADLVVWLRWQQLVRVDQVWVTQADLAKQWSTTERTIRREQHRLVELGLLEVERAPGGVCRYAAAEIVSRAKSRVLGAGTAQWIHDDAHLLGDRPEAVQGSAEAILKGRGGPDKFGTRSGQVRHQQVRDSLTRTREHAVALHTVGTSVPDSRTPTLPESGAEASPSPQAKTTAGGRDWAWRQAQRIVTGQRWLANSPARWKIAATLAKLLRSDLPGVDPATAARAVGQIDPGEATDQHVRLVRQAVAGLVADTKAARPLPAPAHRPITARTVPNDRSDELQEHVPAHRSSAVEQDQAVEQDATSIDLGWATVPAGTEPRWSTTAPTDRTAARWLATLWLRSPSTSVDLVQRRLPQHWHDTAALIHDQVVIARAHPGRAVRLGGLPA